MIGRLRVAWLFVRGSLWFLPFLMSVVAVGLALYLSVYSGPVSASPVLRSLLFSGDAQSARSLLAALLSAMITMTALVVSITIVVLTLAAGQLGPRVIRHFIGDRATQAVLGLFVATILYVLMVLRALNEASGETFPHLAVSVATLLSALCVFTLLFFIHKLARSIMADNVVRVVHASLLESIAQICPERTDDRVPPRMPDEIGWVVFEQDGYIQAFILPELIQSARESGAVIWIDLRAGHYLMRKGRQIGVSPAHTLSDDMAQSIHDAVVIGGERTYAQDLEYGIRQLVEIGLRALSPGINDPFTALIVIDSLMSGLSKIFDRGLEPRMLFDDKGELRVVRRVSDYQGLVGLSFDQLRQAGRSLPAILVRMAENIGRLAPHVRTDDQRAPLLAQIEAILGTAQSAAWVGRDLAILQERCATARSALESRL